MYAVCVEYYGKFGAIVPSGNEGLQKLHNEWFLYLYGVKSK